MNSLTSFKGATFPLKDFLQSVSKDTICPASISITQNKNTINVDLPNKLCSIKVTKNAIKVCRLNQLSNFPKDNELTYPISTIDDAKQVTGLLSGICIEFGCKSYKEADDTVKTLFKILVDLSF